MGWLQKENREHSIRSYLGHLKVGFMERLRSNDVHEPTNAHKVQRKRGKKGREFNDSARPLRRIFLQNAGIFVLRSLALGCWPHAKEGCP
ncbi:hypothetical protein BLL38_05355 [Pseudomonas gessardii]|nr:hypothetical protein BLL38_05355 [Pseudomonas gessardii]